MNKTTAVQCMVIYQFLKNNCAGKENTMGGITICYYIMDDEKTAKYFPKGLTKVILQARINALRKNLVPNKTITRRIGSSPKGYWLDTKEDDNGIEFLKRLAVSHIKTAVKSGVKVEFFHQVLNSLENNNYVDGQTRIPMTPNQKKIIKVFSDDIA